jgi:glycosyltransferase involved in cell wall biosynthesis
MLWSHAVSRRLGRSLRDTQCDAVIEIGDLAAVDRPFFVFQDLSFDVLIDRLGTDRFVPHFRGLDHGQLSRLRDRQHRIYEQAAGVLAMSRWLATQLVDQTGLPAHKVHIVHPGISTPALPIHDRPIERRRRKLLFVGRDFHTKAGDLVVRSLALARRSRPDLTLTVCGPTRWPLDGSVPAGVRFLGPVPTEAMPDLYDRHDLLVMPSRLEGFGIVFAEALARGLPCIGRDDFAMSEVIRPRENGDLVTSDDPGELAERILATLSDTALYARCRMERAEVHRHFSWERAADDTLAAVRTTLGIGDHFRG